MLQEGDIQKIRELSAKDDRIAVVYVFGSVAAGKDRKKSDIDLALMIRGSMEPMERVNMETSLSNLLRRDVDLILFHDCSPLLQHQVLLYGHLLYEADQRERIRQETFARRAYLDSAFLHRKLRGEPVHGGY